MLRHLYWRYIFI